MYGEGISKTGEVVDMGVDFDIIEKSGAWYSYGGAKIAQGREAAKRFFADNPELALEVEHKVKAAVTGTPEAEQPAEKASAKEKKLAKSNGKAKK